MTDLLTLAVSERAEQLVLQVGQPPIVYIGGEANAIEGPVISPGNADSLLRVVAGTRYMRLFRNQGAVAFTYTFEDAAQFRVQASLERGEIRIDLLRIAA